MRVRVLIVCLFAAWLGSALASAQEPPSPVVETMRISLDAGYSSGASHMNGSSIGATFSRDLGRRFGVEASGAYLGQGMDADALSLSASLLLYLRSNHQKVAPYLAVGGGLYRASFDMGNDRFGGPMGNGGFGNGMMGSGNGMMGYGPGYPGAGYGQMPMFYGNRMGGMMGSGNRNFSDPAVSVGGGLRIGVGSKLDLRPDARALVVTSDGETYTVGLLTVSLGYRF